MSPRTLLSVAFLAASVRLTQATSLNVKNNCPAAVFLFTQTSVGSILNNVQLQAGVTQNMQISGNWDGAINTGVGCNSAGQCATGGPAWDGVTPFSRAEFNFNIAGAVNYDLSAIYGWNVGMEITTGGNCDSFACKPSLVPGPQMSNNGPPPASAHAAPPLGVAPVEPFLPVEEGVPLMPTLVLTAPGMIASARTLMAIPLMTNTVWLITLVETQM